MASPQTDAELLEWASKLVVEALGRTLQAKADGLDEAEAFAAGRMGMGEGVERIADADLREIGCVKELPLRFRHWVYRHRKDQEKVYIIGWLHRMRLQTVGYTEMACFIRDERERN
jgi:hypothetical protein